MLARIARLSFGASPRSPHQATAWLARQKYLGLQHAACEGVLLPDHAYGSLTSTGVQECPPLVQPAAYTTSAKGQLPPGGPSVAKQRAVPFLLSRDQGETAFLVRVS